MEGNAYDANLLPTYEPMVAAIAARVATVAKTLGLTMLDAS
jgi:hypothetical protein